MNSCSAVSLASMSEISTECSNTLVSVGENQTRRVNEKIPLHGQLL